MNGNSHLILTLGKVMVAAAWADGEVTTEEVNSLKDLLFRLPELTAQEWAELDIYIETPVSADERARLVADLRDAINTPTQKQLALDTIDAVIRADGEVTPDEQRVANEIKQFIETADTSIVAQIGGLLRGPVRRRSAAVDNREVYLEDFIRNKVYYGVRRRLDLGDDVQLNIAEADMRKFSLIGGLLGSVAHVNRRISDEEVQTISTALQHHFEVNPTAAMFIAEVATRQDMASIDGFRTAREALAVLTPEQVEQVLDVLFEVAAADGMADQDEIEEIRNIARRLKLSNEQFIQAKLKIPRERRAS